MAGQILASGRSGGGATSINLGAGSPLAGDLLVVMTVVNSTGSPALPSAAGGGGATWALAFSSSRSTVWVGTNPTSVGTLTVTGSTSAMAAFWIRGVDPAHVAGSEKVTPDPLAASTLTADAMIAGATNIMLTLATASDAMPHTGSLPSVAAWTAVAAGTTRTAVATPLTATTYAAVTNRALASRQVMIQARIGITPPTAPTALTLTPTETTIDIDWTAPTGGGAAAGYTVSLDGGTPVDVGNVLTHTLTGLTPATNYDVDVHAYNAAGTGTVAAGTVDTLGPPDAPTGLVLTPVATDSITAAWTTPAGPEAVTGFTLAVDGGTPLDVGMTFGWSLTALAPSTLYTIDVRAYSVAGTSSPVTGSATTLDAPPDPIPPGGWAAHLRVGDHTWDVVSTDEADYGPVAGLRVQWTAAQDDGWPTQPDFTTITFGVVAPEGTDLDDVDQGTVVHYTFTPDGYDEPLVNWGGIIRDAVARPVDQGMLYSMVAVDHLTILRDIFVTRAFIDAGTPINDIWDQLAQDATEEGSGEGTSPSDDELGYPLNWVNPTTGQDTPGIDGGFALTDRTYDGTTWDVLTSYAAGVTFRPGALPLKQRLILGYRLDVDGNLDPALPFPGTWMRQGSTALEEVELPGALVPTDSTEWARQRIEPNVVHYPGTTRTERPHDGGHIIRTRPGTSPGWVLNGLEGESQWATQLEVLASRDPALVAGWFALPAAMNTYVTVTDIDPRHTPDGSGVYAGLLAGAALVVNGKSWSVAFALRRTQPDPLT